jgi:hypothetical protein
MTKFLGLAAAAILALGTQANASTLVDASKLQMQTMAQAQLTGLNWTVGDQADYKVSIGGFINGTSHNSVSKDEGTSIWMTQDMDLGFAGKQLIEVQFEKATGKILKMLVGGKEQQVPDASDVEVVEMHEDNVTVPAGSFPCIYAKIKSKKDNSIQEAWINPQVVPMSGLLKALADSQFGKVTQEATAFKFAGH